MYVLPKVLLAILAQNMADEVFIIRTKRGGESAIYKGYRYHKQKLIKSNQLWRCIQKKSCPGTMLTNKNKLFKLLKPHTCKPNFLENEKLRLFDQSVKAASKIVEPSFKLVLESILSEYIKCGIPVDEELRYNVRKRLYVMKKYISFSK